MLDVTLGRGVQRKQARQNLHPKGAYTLGGMGRQRARMSSSPVKETQQAGYFLKRNVAQVTLEPDVSGRKVSP